MKSQFKKPSPTAPRYCLSHRGKFHVEGKRDERRGDFVITVNRKIVDRIERMGDVARRFHFWVANAECYKTIYFIPQKGRKQ